MCAWITRPWSCSPAPRRCKRSAASATPPSRCEGQDDSPIDAFGEGVNRFTGEAVRVLDYYYKHCVSSGADAQQAMAYVKLRLGRLGSARNGCKTPTPGFSNAMRSTSSQVCICVPEPSR